MKNSLPTRTKTLQALVIACVAAVYSAQPAAAQVATGVKCNGCVKSKQVKNNGIRSKDIRDGTVRNADLGSNAVTGDKIAPGAVGASEVAGGSIPTTDLSNEAGGSFSGGNQLLTLPTTYDVIVRSVSVTAPSDGLVFVNATGTFSFGSGGTDTGKCSITTEFAVDFDNSIRGGDSGSNVKFMAFAGTRGFNVGPGTTKFYLICTAVGSVKVIDSQMTAMFLPTTY